MLFYYAVVHVITKKSVALAWISEQFSERIPPVVQDFLKHTSLLYQHIDNATTKIIKSIESLLIDTKSGYLRRTLHNVPLLLTDSSYTDSWRQQAQRVTGVPFAAQNKDSK